MKAHIWTGSDNCDHRPIERRSLCVFILELHQATQWSPDMLPKIFFYGKKKKENPTLRATKDTTARGTDSQGRRGGRYLEDPLAFTPDEANAAFTWQLNLPSAAFSLEHHLIAHTRPRTPLRRRPCSSAPPTPRRTRGPSCMGSADNLFDIYLFIYFFIFFCLFFFVLFPLLAHSPAPASPLRVHMQYTYIILVSLSWWNISVFLMQSAFQEEAGNSCFISRHRFPWWISGIEWVRWPGYARAVWWAGGVWILWRVGGVYVVMLSLAMWCVGESIPERWCLQSRLYYSGVAYGVVHTSAVFTR